MTRDEIKNKINIKKHQIKKIEIKKIRIKPKTNTNWDT
jgi:methyltransferase-like protein